MVLRHLGSPLYGPVSLNTSRSRSSKHFVSMRGTNRDVSHVAGIQHAALDSTSNAMSQKSDRLRPKQSLSQNFLCDKAVASTIVETFADSVQEICPEAEIVEIGPGTGALTTFLWKRFPSMRALELDQRAVEILKEKLPDLNVQRANILQVDWKELAQSRGHGLAVIGNLPYNIVSQIMFNLLEAPPSSVRIAVVTMQREVAERVTAVPRTKAYGILSVVSQLYAKPTLLFNVSNTAFRPVPKVESTVVRFEFIANPELDIYNRVLTSGLRTIIRTSFQQRRKTLRNTLKTLCAQYGVELPEKWLSRRPEELPPQEFIELTKYIYSTELQRHSNDQHHSRTVEPVWRSTAKPTEEFTVS